MNDDRVTWEFEPYREGYGPRFRLVMHELGDRWKGRLQYAYELSELTEHGDSEVIFKNRDFCGPLIGTLNWNQLAENILGFLTCRPGDTDDEFFENYSPRQLAFCDQYAEDLSSTAREVFDEG